MPVFDVVAAARPGEVVDELQALEIHERRRVRIGPERVDARDRDVPEPRARHEEQASGRTRSFSMLSVASYARFHATFATFRTRRPDDPLVLADERLRRGPRVGRPVRNRRVLIHLRLVPRVADRQRVAVRERVIDLAEGVVLVRRRRDLHRVQAGGAGLAAVRLGIQQQVRGRVTGADVGPRARVARLGTVAIVVSAAILAQPFVAAEEERPVA